MKKLSVILVVLLLLGGVTVHAQGFHLGIKAAANMGKIDGKDLSTQYKLGYAVGAFAEINFTKGFGIQPEVLWNESKSRTESDFDQTYRGFSGQSITLDYLTIPLMLNFRPTPLLTIQVGPQYGILINHGYTLFQNGQHAFKDGDFSVSGGAQVNLGGFKVGARYNVGLSNLNDLQDQYKWKSQALQLYVGLRII